MLFLFQISSLSVQSNTVQSVQSSYNPFEDEEDTGSTVSEKEDNKIKKLVKCCFFNCFHTCTFSVQGFLFLVSITLCWSVHDALLSGYVSNTVTCFS